MGFIQRYLCSISFGFALCLPEMRVQNRPALRSSAVHLSTVWRVLPSRQRAALRIRRSVRPPRPVPAESIYTMLPNDRHGRLSFDFLNDQAAAKSIVQLRRSFVRRTSTRSHPSHQPTGPHHTATSPTMCEVNNVLLSKKKV